MARALLILECRIEYVKEGVPYKHIVDEIVWKQLRHRNPFRVEDLAHPIKRSIVVSPQPFRRYVSLLPYSLHRLGSVAIHELLLTKGHKIASAEGPRTLENACC